MEESPRKVYVNSPIFTEEDAKTFQYVNPELDLEEEEDDQAVDEEPTSLRLNQKQRQNNYDKQNNHKERDENDRDPLTLFRSSEWQYVVKKPDEKQTRKVLQENRSRQTYDDEAAERLEIEERTQSHRYEAIRNKIPSLDLIDSGDDAMAADSLDLEISDGKHVTKFKHTAGKPVGKKVEVLKDSLEEGNQDYRDDNEADYVMSRDSLEERKDKEIDRNGYHQHKDPHQNGYFLHKGGAPRQTKPITASNGAKKPTQNLQHQHASPHSQKPSQDHQHQQQNWNESSNRSDAKPPVKVFHKHTELSLVHEHSRENDFTPKAQTPHNPQNNLYFQKNEQYRPHVQLPDDANSFETRTGGNQFSRGIATNKQVVPSQPEKDFVEGNRQLITKPPKTKKTYGEIYFRKKTQENPNTALPLYTDRRKVASADNINSYQFSYETDNQEESSYRGRDGKVAEHLWQSRAENLAKRKSSGQSGKPLGPGGLRKYPSESKMDLKRSDQSGGRSKAAYGGGGGGSAPYLSRHTPHHLNPLEQQLQLQQLHQQQLHQQQLQQQQLQQQQLQQQQLQQQQLQQQLQKQQQLQQQQQWVPAANQAFPNNIHVQDAAQQQLQQLQQNQLLQKQLQQQYQQQQLPQQQLQQIQEQQQQQLFQQIQKQQLHKQQIQQQHVQQQQLQQQQLQQQQLQQQQLQQQQLQQQQQQQLQQQHLYQQQLQQHAKQQDMQQQLHMQQPLLMQQLKQQPMQLQNANPVYGGTSDPLHHIITTEDGRKVSVDINLKLLKPTQNSAISVQPGFPTQQFPAQQQMTLNSGYPNTVFHPIAQQVFQEVQPGNPYAATISAPGLNTHQVVGQQISYHQLPEANHAAVMNQTGFPQPYGNALPVSVGAEQSAQRLPPKTKHPLSPFRILPPVSHAQNKTDKKQKDIGQMVSPLKFNDQTTTVKELGEKGGGGGGRGYMEQYQKQRNKQQDYKKYTLDDYRKLQKEAKLSNLGSLGPDVESEYHREKKGKAVRQQEYARQIKERNRVELEQQRQKQSELLSPDSINEQSETKAKRDIALDYAKKVPKPQTVIRSADGKHTSTVASGNKKQSIRYRRPSDSQLPQPHHHPQESWNHPPQLTTDEFDIDFDELQKLRERHEQERQRLEMLLQNGHALYQNA